MTVEASSKPLSEHRYLPIVDTLRAVSVLSVVGYHIGLAFMPGGFVGVDVFFVISGYLIINQIVSAREKGTFSFATFWSRRALRILPPYFIVILFTLAAAPFVLALPEEYYELGEQALWSSLMVVNHYFLSQQGYFDTAADLKPLLHLWSLAVEEQFYIAAPLVIAALMALRRFQPWLTWSGSAVIFAGSFALCVWFTQTGDEANYAFFLMPLRAWEFVAGGMLGALIPWARRYVPSWGLQTLMLVGFGMIIYAVATFSADTPFPSFWAAIPVIGACLVICGGVAAGPTFAVRLLTPRPVLWLGLVSYAWYLWHWPLLAYARIYTLGEPPIELMIAMGAISFVLADLTHRFVERPIRQWRDKTGVDKSWKPTIGGVVSSAPFALAGLAFFSVLSPQIAASIPASMTPPSQGSAGVCGLNNASSPDRCVERVGNLRTGLLFGDSHARSLYEVLQDEVADEGIEIVSVTPHSCPPIIGVRAVNRSGNPTTANDTCVADKNKGLALIEEGGLHPDFAVLFARWVVFTPWEGRAAGGETFRVLNLEGKRGIPEDPKAIFVEQLRETVQTLQSDGMEKVLIIEPVPELYRSAPSCMVRGVHYGADLDEMCSIPLADVVARRSQVIDWISEAVEGVPNVRLIDPLNVICDDKWCRPYDLSDPTVVLYRDDHHLSRAGMERLYRQFTKDFDWAISK